MKAMVFAAGLGTRLAPLTDSCPKALIEVGGKPMLERAIENVREAGAESVVVNVHHHSEMIIDFIRSRDFGIPVAVSDESDMLLDTGGGVVKALPMLLDGNGDDDVILYNADIYTDLPLKCLVDAHRATGSDATLLTQDRATSRYLLFDSGGHMRGWRNASTGEVRSPFPPSVTGACVSRAFGGIHVLGMRILRDMADYCPEGKFSITTYYVYACDRMDIRSFTPAPPYDWVDIGRPETLSRARELASRK